MQRSPASDRKLRRQLMELYSGLSPLQQDVIHILALIYDYSARTNILNALKRLHADDLKIKKQKVSDLDPILDGLVSARLVEENGIHFQCADSLKEPICRRLVEVGRFDEIADAVSKTLPMTEPSDYSYEFPSFDEILREMRMAVYRQDIGGLHELLHYYDEYHANHTKPQDHPFVLIFGKTFDLKWIRDFLPEDLQAEIAGILTDYYQVCGISPDLEVFSFLRIFALLDETENGEKIRQYLAEQLILDGRPDEAEQMVEEDSGQSAFLIRGFAAFLRGDNDAAITLYETALALLKKGTRKRKIYFDSLSGLFFILALIKSSDAKRLEEADAYAAIAEKKKNHPQQRAFAALSRLIAAKKGDPDALESIRTWNPAIAAEDAVSSLIQCLARYWMNRAKAGYFSDSLKHMFDFVVIREKANPWLMAELSALIRRMKIKTQSKVQDPAEFFEQSGYQRILDLIEPESSWQRALTALIHLNQSDEKKAAGNRTSRLVWLLDFHESHGYWDLSPREQVKSARGNWSKGRKIALKRLCHTMDSFDFLTTQDKKICSTINEEHSTNWYGYPEINYYFPDSALKALAGHPLVFSSQDLGTPLDIVSETPALMVNEEKGKFEIKFVHSLDTKRDVQLIQDAPTRFRVVETGKDVLTIAKIIGKGLKVPAAGKKQLLEAVGRISSTVTVHSQLKGVGRTAQAVTAEATPIVHLRPLGDGLKLDVWSQPFTLKGPCFRPGEGGRTVVCEIDGKSLRTRRDLEKERELAEAAVAACPLLSSTDTAEGGRWDWELPDPETCLELLVALKALDSQVVVKWPEGESLAVRGQVDMNQLFVQVRKSQDWFAVSGELKLDDDRVMSMEKLIDMLDHARGRFVPLADGQFLALTRAFRKRLEEIHAYSNKSGKQRRFHPLVAFSLQDMAGEFGGISGDKHWKAHSARMEAARSLRPRVPSTLKADLRDYQVDGFIWLARLCHWGVGACLADDMGLGKTIQALAVMLTRASEGPCLVVAPTSVLMNWETEVARFAPSLNVVRLNSGDREKIASNLNPFDLLLVSYGLLQQEKVATLLAGVHFEVIVLDEAQAIKNRSTKRSKAAMDLDGGFRLITTGTPIENHLGELWNLFRFINPGLLGSLTSFNEKFAVPIESNHDRSARQRLKKLVQPFILRRTKSQVLDELPRRTDILIQVELSDDERAFYEALRRKALESLDGDEGMNPGLQLKILGEIMKLRRACCHPTLVLPDAGMPSAKLSAFGDIVTELMAGGHKALVFSQFTGHLKIIRDYVERQSIPYQYLDGQTPEKDRRQRVTAFQDGDGDLFLISLRAGGVGLNLTAADYVIHMDPWWNPAVEDQAADRAHRIGQTRPVTVYSLIARHTIEEKIVSLHRSKRDLADSLLDGADLSGKMSADELLGLIREG